MTFVPTADTAGLHDNKSRTFFSSDCFGALLSGPAQTAGDISTSDLQEGQLLWATFDAPWLHKIDAKTFTASLDEVRKMEPEMILSSHLPPAYRMTEQLIGTLATAPTATPFVDPDQEALQQMLAQLTGDDARAAVTA